MVIYHYTINAHLHALKYWLIKFVGVECLKNYLIVRALQEAQDIFGVDFDFDEFGYGEEDEFEEEDEVSLIPESAQIECTCPWK